MQIPKQKTVALNKAVFKTRTITAVIFAVVMLAGLFINGYSFTLLFVIIGAGCLYEFTKIMRLIKPGKHLKFLPLAVPYIIVPILLMLGLGGVFKTDPPAAPAAPVAKVRVTVPVVKTILPPQSNSENAYMA